MESIPFRKSEAVVKPERCQDLLLYIAFTTINPLKKAAGQTWREISLHCCTVHDPAMFTRVNKLNFKLCSLTPYPFYFNSCYVLQVLYDVMPVM